MMDAMELDTEQLIDALQREGSLTLRQLAARLNEGRGSGEPRVHPESLRKAVVNGRNGVRLAAWYDGKSWRTSMGAYRRYRASLTDSRLRRANVVTDLEKRAREAGDRIRDRLRPGK